MEYQKSNFGFVVLAPDNNIGGIISTINSIRAQHPEASYVCVIPEEASKQIVDEIKGTCTVLKGKATITSLINVGIKEGHSDWNIILMAGAFVRRGVVKRLFRPVKDELDIVFPIVAEYDRQGKPTRLHDSFPDSTLNGLMINSNTFKKVGEFEDTNLEMSKIIWSLDAGDFGCKFKGVLGSKIV